MKSYKKDNDELRSSKVKRVMGKLPTSLIRINYFVMIMCIVVIIIILLSFDELNILGKILNHFNLRK
jgi:hypothetical protein